MGEQVTLRHHCMTHQYKSWHLREILIHTTTHPICYWTFHMTQIQIQVFQILSFRVHLTHKTMIVINKDDVQKMTKRNHGVKRVLINQSKITKSVQPRYLHPHTNQRLLSSKLDEDPLHRRVYFLSFVNSLKIVYHNFQKHKCCLWAIHT